MAICLVPVDKLIHRLIQRFAQRRPLRAGSLLVTIFGDALAPRGGTAWLGSLIKVVEPFGVSARLVRTSVSRLAKDDWLESAQQGRRSYYALSAEGRARFAAATARIYGEPRHQWQGELSLALLTAADADGREVTRKQLASAGYRPLSATLLARTDATAHAADASPGLSQAIMLTARPDAAEDTARLRTLIEARWDLEHLRERYRGFLATFRPLLESLEEQSAGAPPPLSFQVRTMLVHEYRKILLRDPLLPSELVPADWPGLSAYQLCRNLYRHTHQAADEYLSETVENAFGPLPPPEPAFFKRFGGIASDAS